MALNKDKDLKKYFSISEVATQFGVAESVLRFWEKEFPNIKPRKTQRNVRQYTREDIEEVRTVYTLLKVRGMKIAAAREMLSKNKKGATDMTVVLNKLESIKAELLDISRELAELKGTGKHIRLPANQPKKKICPPLKGKGRLYEKISHTHFPSTKSTPAHSPTAQRHCHNSTDLPKIVRHLPRLTTEKGPKIAARNIVFSRREGKRSPLLTYVKSGGGFILILRIAPHPLSRGCV